MEGITISPYTPADYPAFASFARTSFHPKYILADEAFLKWQYTGSGVLMLAKHHNKIVGFFGYEDFLYKVYAETKTIRAVMNLFVAAEYRLAGIGPLLARSVFYTPNPIIVLSYNDAALRLYSHVRAHWREAGDLTRFFAILKPHPLMYKFKVPTSEPASATKDQLIVKRIDNFSLEFDTFWRTIRSRYKVTIERSKQYLNSRFTDHPHLSYETLAVYDAQQLAGYLVYRVEEADGFRIARIIDFVATERTQTHLLQSFLRSAHTDGAHAADFLFSHRQYHQSLTESGFFNVKSTDFEQFPIRFSPLSYNKFVINIAYDLDVPLQDFYLTKADSDQDRPNPH